MADISCIGSVSGVPEINVPAASTVGLFSGLSEFIRPTSQY